MEAQNTDYPVMLRDFVAKSGGGVSFVEITRFLKQFFETEGDGGVFVPSHPNTVFWFGMSEQYIEVITEAVNRKLIVPRPTSPLVYFGDGEYVKLPIATGSRQYKKPHWFPLVFNVHKSKY